MNWWGLAVIALGGLFTAAVVGTYVNETYRQRTIKARQKAFGWLLRSKDEAWFARDVRRGAIGASLVGVLVIVIGIVMLVLG